MDKYFMKVGLKKVNIIIMDQYTITMVEFIIKDNLKKENKFKPMHKLKI